MIEKKTLMSVFITAIMVLSILGFVLVDYGESDTKKTYNGHTFLGLHNGWQTTINDKKLLFAYLPNQLEDLTLPPEIVIHLQTTPVIGVTFDPNSKWSPDFGELQYNMEQILNSQSRFILRGLTNTTNYPKLPKLTCANATQTTPIIYLTVNTTTNATHFIVNNNCITISAERTNDLYRATDRLIYLILGIMQK